MTRAVAFKKHSIAVLQKAETIASLIGKDAKRKLADNEQLRTPFEDVGEACGGFGDLNFEQSFYTLIVSKIVGDCGETAHNSNGPRSFVADASFMVRKSRDMCFIFFVMSCHVSELY